MACPGENAMSRRQDLQHRLHTLAEISSIMGAMKNLSLIETRKLARILGHQQRMLANIETAAADFLHFHPQPAHPPEADLFLVVGSERGFCGGFNEELIEAMASSGEAARFLAVGRRLGTKLEGDPRVAAFVDGPTVTEEVAPVLTRLMDRLSKPGPTAGKGLKALYHDEDGAVSVRPLLPMPSPPPVPQHPDPPLLNLPTAAFFDTLVEHYLFAALHQLFYSSLMAENRRRLQHMEHAIEQMERTIAASRLKYNALRQEEITEEIEIIMLSADALVAGQIEH